jgi:hypothetical protein
VRQNVKHIDKMNYKSKYKPKKIRKQYNTGGYGSITNYGSNNYEAQADDARRNSLNANTAETYNVDQEALISNYRDNIQKTNLEIQQSNKTQSQVKSGINFALAAKADNGKSYLQNLNSSIGETFNDWGSSNTEIPTNVLNDNSAGINMNDVKETKDLTGYAAPALGASGQGYINLGNSAGPNVPSGNSVSGDFMAPAAAPTPAPTTLSLNTVQPGSAITPNTSTPGGGSAPPAVPGAVPPESPGTFSAGNAPIKGGPWTMAVDMGLNYLSDDNDASTYTGGEVATDVASLALNLGTFNWIGAGMKLWDMGSQWMGMSKAKKAQKKEKERIRSEGITLGNEYTKDMQENSQARGSRKSHLGKRSVYGSGSLGGFKYNI